MKRALFYVVLAAAAVALGVLLDNVWPWVAGAFGLAAASESKKRLEDEPYHDPEEDDVQEPPRTSSDLDDFVRDVHNRDGE